MNDPKPLTKLPAFVTLCCIGYNVTVHEGLIVFEESHCMSGFHQRIAFERTDCQGGGCWYLQFDTTFGKISVEHIVKAYEMVCEVYGKAFEEKRPL